MPTAPIESGELDVLIVGAGFAGLYNLFHLRKLGIKVKVFEAGSGLGGTWYWNRYPGARVDSHVPLYEFSMEELWKDWIWKEKFPGQVEILDYFKHAGSKLDLEKDIRFNTRVVSTQFDVKVDRWGVKAEDGTTAQPRFLILCTGLASKRYVPSFEGLDKFEGIVHHTSAWPHDGVALEGKRVAVIGTGASGVQVIQEIAPVVKHLTVLQRTPNIAFPMGQALLDQELQTKRKELYPIIFRRRLQTIGGLEKAFIPKDFFSASEEERRLVFEDLWERQGFDFFLSNYQDIAFNEEANTEVYNFWRDKIRKRIRDPIMQELLAPTLPPHPVGTKRPSLEQSYYEVFNQPNVTLIDVGKNPIVEMKSNALVTGDGVHHELDVLVLATGFDSITGGITQIDIQGVDGTSIKEKWANGVYTQLGMTTANFPNMFFLYGPQAPTALSNGPTCIEIQVDWVVNCIREMLASGITRIEATREAEVDWHNKVMHLSSLGLFHKARSWYTGANIPGKPIEQLNFAGGIPAYATLCHESAAKGYEGFALSKGLPSA